MQNRRGERDQERSASRLKTGSGGPASRVHFTTVQGAMIGLRCKIGDSAHAGGWSTAPNVC